MNRFNHFPALPIVLLLACCSSYAQTTKEPPVSKVFAKLETQVDSKTSAKGDEVLLTTLNDLSVNGKVVIPKGSKLLGHLGGVVNKSKDEPKSVLGIIIDKAIVKGGDIPLQGIIAAIAAPQKALTDDPAYEMMHSNEPKMVGSGSSSAASSGSLSASSKASSTAAVATAQLKGASDPSILLTEDSQGAMGYEGVSITWSLTIPPPLTIFATSAKSLKILSGTQMLLRMIPPQAPN